MALMLVLAILGLMVILVIGFLLRAGSASRTVVNARAIASARQMSDLAVNLVEAQINDATTQGTPANPVAWASEPGALWLFDAAGAMKTIYRLYSSTALTTANTSDLANDLPSNSWQNSPAQWVDLNAPSSVTSGSTVQTYYPILDWRNPGNLSQVAPIDGFSLGAATPSAPNGQQAPMPVRWLYVLQNGQIVSPTVGTNGTVVSISGASAANPIVGRIAFWTDDESCKVNINTAGGDGVVSTANDYSAVANATFWDVPRFNYADDRAMAQYQPAGGEYQRYPGHPATTALHKIFADLGASLTSAEFYSLLPRYSLGGSQGGTAIPTTAVPKKSNRLYSAIGELLFDPARKATKITQQQVETGKFFLTTHSQAPEVNLLGRPRVSIWPIHDTADAAHRSTLDKLFAVCSAVNGNPYYFTRRDSASTTTDINLSRNAKLLGYLDSLTSTAIPGYGGSFKGKYGADQRQILTEIFDYVRATNLRDPTVTTPYAGANTTSASGALNDWTDGGGQVAPSVQASWGTQGLGRFPILSEVSMLLVGVGKGSTSAGAAIPVPVDQLPNGSFTPAANKTAAQAFLLLNFFDPGGGITKLNPSFTVRVTGLSAFTLGGQALGMPAAAAEYVFKSGVPALAPYSEYSQNGVMLHTGILDFRCTMGFRMLGANGTNNGSTLYAQFPFYSTIVQVPNAPANPTLGAASLTIDLFTGNSTAAANHVQTYKVNFPSQTVVLPGVAANGARFGSSSNWQNQSTTAAPPDRSGIAPLASPATVIDTANDAALSMVPGVAWGDPRIMAVATVPAAAFTTHPSAGSRFAAGLRMGNGWPYGGASVGKLVAGASASINGDITARPDAVSARVQGAYLGGTSAIPGDWDNGLADSVDGPYINRADEAASFNTCNGGMPYYLIGGTACNEYGPGFFSPNRMVPSPGAFGSLPTGVLAQKSWQTLLFRPGPSGHPGLGSPPDYLMLDLFWMPVVEPYAISVPLATEGKVNLNYQILPFTYITRSTAVKSALAGEKVAAVPLSRASTYKTLLSANAGNARLPLNLSDTDGTLRQFKEKFATPSVFKSAADICSVYLVPSNENWASDATAQSTWYGTKYSMVGDNTRERPYADIYSRVTTKSNVFTVYYTVQSLKNPVMADQGKWNEDQGIVMGEYRGSTGIERYIDPNDTTLPDYAAQPNAASLENFYKWRVIANTQFAP